ncbi:MAG TPA: cell division protein FtsA [Candidatus Saccharimonadales bacterium]|nr:cell division protein FtsA [Candidatus Saccharimonadales bacterium]
MREQSQSHFVGLDVGTSAVRCVIGMLDENSNEDIGKPSIIGHGSVPNIGMRKGVVVHIDDVAEAISQAVNEAERVSGIRVTSATVNVNGSHVVGMNSRGVIAISGANREISIDDRMRVEEAAAIVKLPPNREILQIFAKNYRLDGQDNIKDPVGMQGVRLEVDTHILTALTPNLRSLDHALEKAHLHANHHTVSSLAAAEAVLSRQQKESGTVLLDIGAGTTNLVIIEDGEVQHVAVIPVGGINITNDLAIGLKTDLDIAEAVKIQQASLSTASRYRKGAVTLGKHRYVFDNEEIHMIVEARVEELLEYVDKELRKIGRSRKLPGGVVIVGGTAKLPGLDEFAKEKLQLAARVGKLEPIKGLIEAVSDSAYATAIGLMLLDMLLLPSGAHYQTKNNRGVIETVESVFKLFRRRR